MRSFLRAIRRVLERARVTSRSLWERVRQPVLMELVTGELPPRLRRRRLYIVSDDGFDEEAAMICPCGCKQVLYMNLLTDERPCWRIDRDDRNLPTLHPSVWRQKGCCSHFWLKRGRIVWC